MIDEGKPERREVWKRPKFALLLHYRSPSTRSGRQKRRRQGGALETWSLMNTKSRDAVKELFYFYCYFIPPNVGLQKPSKGKSQILAKQQIYELKRHLLDFISLVFPVELWSRSLLDIEILKITLRTPAVAASRTLFLDTSYCIHFSRFFRKLSWVRHSLESQS